MSKINQKHENPSLEIHAPPHAVDLEEAVLGACILSTKAIIRILPIFKAEAFYKPSHCNIAQSIINLTEKDIPVDIVTVVQELKKMGKLEEVGGAHRISQLSNGIATEQNIEIHYRMLLEYYFRREMISISTEGVKKSYDETEDVFETFDWINGRLEGIEVFINSGGHQSVQNVKDQIQSIINPTTEKVNYYPVGERGLDEILMISPGNLLGVSGKSGSGKTSWVIHMMKKLLFKYPNEVSICWYTMEDEPEKLIVNMISSQIKLAYNDIHGKNYVLSAKEKKEIEKHLKTIEGFDIEFFHQKAMIGHVKAHFQRFCAKRPKRFNILIIDNLMLLKDNQTYRFKSRGTEVDEHIANEIQDTFVKTKANFDVNVLFVNHLTKEQLAKTNFKEGYRPREDNIRGSGRFLDICTQNILINRPGLFDDITAPYKETGYYEALKSLCLLEVTKNRNGRLGLIRYFSNLDYKIFQPF